MRPGSIDIVVMVIAAKQSRLRFELGRLVEVLRMDMAAVRQVHELGDDLELGGDLVEIHKVARTDRAPAFPECT
jgi:hypothetical protein